MHSLCEEIKITGYLSVVYIYIYIYIILTKRIAAIVISHGCRDNDFHCLFIFSYIFSTFQLLFNSLSKVIGSLIV